LSDKSAELRHAHGCDADMTLHRNARPHDRFDIFSVIFVTLAFHHFGIGLVHEAAGIGDRLFGRDMETPIGHVDHAQSVF
jgi:hypothetical protein